jgi:hypothetical protein
MNRWGPSTVCPDCGQDLDGGEICDCNEEERNWQEEFYHDDD